MSVRRLVIALVGASCLAGPLQAAGLEERAAACAACHGETGKPVDPSIPTIWGQQLGYLYLQLRDFKRGDRKNEAMQAIVADFERADMMALAEYFSQKPWPHLAQPRASKEVETIALRVSASIGCPACHLDRFQGDGTVPRLAGMGRDYLERSMIDFRSRARGNNPGMSDLMNVASPEELTALADYLAGL